VSDPKNSVEIRDGSFSWDRESKEPTLKNLNLEIPKGSLTAIVGIVGSGKSSIISAILGDVHKVSGDISRVGSVAYVPQIAW
jgi:ATP-binding cassette subfamily C (CFTR/MRP) protein 3